jgi:hypothetical protein
MEPTLTQLPKFLGTQKKYMDTSSEDSDTETVAVAWMYATAQAKGPEYIEHGFKVSDVMEWLKPDVMAGGFGSNYDWTKIGQDFSHSKSPVISVGKWLSKNLLGKVYEVPKIVGSKEKSTIKLTKRVHNNQNIYRFIVIGKDGKND